MGGCLLTGPAVVVLVPSAVVLVPTCASPSPRSWSPPERSLIVVVPVVIVAVALVSDLAPIVSDRDQHVARGAVTRIVQESHGDRVDAAVAMARLLGAQLDLEAVDDPLVRRRVALSPLPLIDSSPAIEIILQPSVASETSTVSVTWTILWFGGHSESGWAATPAMTGGAVSATVTVVMAFVMLPPPSVAVNVTVVTPSGNTAGASLVTGNTRQLSVAVGSGTATGAPASAVGSILIGAGTFRSFGASLSWTW